jgi:hypothetical protein
MLALLAAEVTRTAEATNEPVWWLFAATAVLAVATAALAVAAWVGLGQLKVARRQLEDVRTERHVEVFLEMARRWESPEMSEALELEKGLSSQALRRVFDDAERPRSRNPLRERRYAEAARQTVVLLRVPNYFEDAAMIARVGGLEETLVLENFGAVASVEWERWSLTVRAMQETDDLAYVGFENLVRRALKADEEREKARASAARAAADLRTG